jgi:hypothetical protein
MLHVFIIFYLVWCNVLMRIYIYIYVCLFVPICIRYALRIDRDSFPSFEESTVKRWRPGDRVLQVLQS